MSAKPRKGRKAAARLAARIRGYEDTTKGNGDTFRKHQLGFRKPGSNKK